MQIDWLTVSAQLVNFLVLVWLLKRFLYQPVVKAMNERERRIVHRIADAEQREREAETRAQDYTNRISALEEGRSAHLDEARAEADREKRRLLAEARQDIEHQRSKWYEELEREQQDLRSVLQRGLCESALKVTQRTLADLADATLEERIVATFLQRFQALPEDTRRAFKNFSEPLALTSSFDLDDGTRERIHSVVQETLGGAIEIEYVRDPALLCGIELAGKGQKFAWNIKDYLGDLDDRVGTLLATRSGSRVTR